MIGRLKHISERNILAPILAADARVLLPFLQPYHICVELNKVKKAKI